MTDQILDTLIRAGTTPTVMAVFCYFTYKYLTSQGEKKDARIDAKDQIILAQHRQILDMTRLFIETQNNTSKETTDVLKIVLEIEQKQYQIIQLMRDIKTYIPK